MLKNWKDQDKLDSEIAATEDLLEQFLSKLSRLRRQKRKLRERSDEFVRRYHRMIGRDATLGYDNDLRSCAKGKESVGTRGMGDNPALRWSPAQPHTNLHVD